MTCRIHLTTSLLSTLALTAAAQRPDSLTGELRQTFREVTAVHELPDGRTLVLDSHERFVYVADFRTGETQVIGEQGWSDRQYLWPSRLLSLTTDTTLVWDAIEGRLHVLDRAGGVPGIRRSIPKTDFGPARQSFVPVMSDSRGRMYRELPTDDGSALLRWTRGDLQADTIFRFRRASVQGLVPSSDKWTVSASGVVAYVHASNYRVDLRAPGGNAVLGKPIPYELKQVTPAVQKAWLEVLNQPRIVWAQVRGQPPAFEERTESWVDYGSWPLVLPAITGRDPLVQFASDGSLLIERVSMPALPTEYDVIDERAELKHRFQLPAGTRIVATGRDVVYVTTRGPDRRLTLRRYSVQRPR